MRSSPRRRAPGTSISSGWWRWRDRARATGGAGPAEPPSLLCLLPVRDGAEDLPGYLRSVDDLGASLVALDDGSSDASAELLRADPRVLAVPAGPGCRERRPTLGRRSQPPGAAGPRGRHRVRLAAVPRRRRAHRRRRRRRRFAIFSASDAVPGLAYGLQLHRAWGDRSDPEPRYVYRLFSRRPEMTLPAERLHRIPSRSRSRGRAWVRTSIRVRHLESPERLERRRAKYELADPEGAHRADTEAMLDAGPRAARRLAAALRDGWRSSAARRRHRRAGRARRRLRRVASAARLPAGGAKRRGRARPTTWRAPGASPMPWSRSTTARATRPPSSRRTSPLVAKVIRNPARDSYAGWDDAANRQTLVDACAELGPRWVRLPRRRRADRPRRRRRTARVRRP